MQVALDGRDLRVADHHRGPHDVAAAAELVGREGVPQGSRNRGWSAQGERFVDAKTRVQ
jgi:hypothetical protein